MNLTQTNKLQKELNKISLRYFEPDIKKNSLLFCSLVGIYNHTQFHFTILMFCVKNRSYDAGIGFIVGQRGAQALLV